MRGSPSPEGVPPAMINVKIIGKIMKNSNSASVEKRMTASFQAMAKSFFIQASYALSGALVE
jgi:hypothetical protein